MIKKRKKKKNKPTIGIEMRLEEKDNCYGSRKEKKGQLGKGTSGYRDLVTGDANDKCGDWKGKRAW